MQQVLNMGWNMLKSTPKNKPNIFVVVWVCQKALGLKNNEPGAYVPINNKTTLQYN